ncbi:MAG: F-box protein [Chlamydiota bacterium]
MSSILHVHGDKRPSTSITPLNQATDRCMLMELPTEVLLKIYGYLKPEDVTKIKNLSITSRSLVQLSTFNQFKTSFTSLLQNISIYLTDEDKILLENTFENFKKKATLSIGYPIGVTLPFDTSKEREALRLTLIECLAKSDKAFNSNSPDCLYTIQNPTTANRSVVWKSTISLPQEFSHILRCSNALYMLCKFYENPGVSIQNKILLIQRIRIPCPLTPHSKIFAIDYQTLIVKKIKAAIDKQDYLLAAYNSLILPKAHRSTFFDPAIKGYVISEHYDYTITEALIQADDPEQSPKAIQAWVSEIQRH